MRDIIDEAGALQLQIKALEKQLEGLKQIIKLQGEGRYDGDQWSALVSEAITRSTPLWALEDEDIVLLARTAKIAVSTSRIEKIAQGALIDLPPMEETRAIRVIFKRVGE